MTSFKSDSQFLVYFLEKFGDSHPVSKYINVH